MSIGRWLFRQLFYAPRRWPRRRRQPERDFYQSRAWLDLRYRVIREYGRTCMACGATRGPMHIDHIRPRSTHPRLALRFDNLQVLCASCNRGKSNKWADDFRARNRKPS